ncbi:TIGR03750 family conjugal transfer protein [Escherichia coli]|nr:TIGR03750 family conjugal transfer protein [Escherichia coli]EFE7117663.1 TIGR03750 family conjugal transfer protein [Escherichia coli]
METIRFLPDRLNAEPTVFRGFTTPELGLAALTGFFTGLLWSLPFVPVFGWVIIPTGALLTPLVLVWTGGAWISRLKRGKPDNWLWQRLEEKKAALGVGRSGLIREVRGWSLRRTRVRGGKS